MRCVAHTLHTPYGAYAGAAPGATVGATGALSGVLLSEVICFKKPPFRFNDSGSRCGRTRSDITIQPTDRPKAEVAPMVCHTCTHTYATHTHAHTHS